MLNFNLHYSINSHKSTFVVAPDNLTLIAANLLGKGSKHNKNIKIDAMGISRLPKQIPVEHSGLQCEQE